MTYSGKHCGKRRNCLFWAISSFVTMFLRRCLLQRRQKSFVWGKGLTINLREHIYSRWLWKYRDKVMDIFFNDKSGNQCSKGRNSSFFKNVQNEQFLLLPQCFPLLVIGYPYSIFDKTCSKLSAAELSYEGKV